MTTPVQVLELRSVRGTGGGPEKTILAGAAQADSRRIRVTVCYIRDRRDAGFGIAARAADAGLDYVEILERHSLDRAIWPALRRLVRDRGIDIVHAHEYKTDLLALLLARSDGVVPLATAHGWTGHSRRERLVYYPADRRLLRRFPAVIAVSSEIRQTLLASGVPPARITTIANGIEASRFRRVIDLGEGDLASLKRGGRSASRAAISSSAPSDAWSPRSGSTSCCRPCATCARGACPSGS